ncbi:MAG: type 3 dihydrofolate reductase [Steroidobacteraceae bacterium]
MLSLILAVADNGVIGQQNGLPWRLPEDLKRFKQVTLGKPVIMGRKTFDSIGKPLPGRTNIVITRQPDLQLPGCTVVPSLPTALVAAGAVEEAMIMGGAEIYRQALPLAQRIYLTQVHAQIEGDAYFEALDAKQWQEIAREDYSADARHAHAYSFVVLERIAG